MSAATPAPSNAATKPAMTFSVIWPASILAKRRTERLTGRVAKETISTNTMNGRRIGVTPEGTKTLRKWSPCRKKPIPITNEITMMASAKVIDDLTGDGEGEGQQAEQIAEEDEHEDREDQREELHALLAAGHPHGRGDEFIGHFGCRLQPSGNDRALGGADQHEETNGGDDDHHEKRCVSEAEHQRRMDAKR